MNKKFLTAKIAILAILILAIAAPAFGAADTVRVWVEYKPGQSAQVRNNLNGVGAQFHFQFDRLNTFVVTVPEKALDNLARNPRVAGIEIDPERSLIEPNRITIDDLPDPNHDGQIIPYGIDAVQARKVWDANEDGVVDEGAPTGADVTVCIIDTGYYSGHEDLVADEERVAGMSQVDDDYLSDGYGHGTHVAGTISALNNDLGVVGVTPGTVDFYIVKIFDNAGEWVPQTHASNLTAAIYECQDNGAKVINMSLGGSSRSYYEERAFDSLYAEGVLSIAAAGNDNNDKFHSPASYPSVVSVAAVDADNAKADFSNFGDTVEIAAPGVGVLSTVPFTDPSYLKVDGVQYSGLTLEFAPYGTATGELVDGGLCGETGDWTGKVVLCERGDFSFYDKLMNVQKSGGTAAVIYNNIPGSFSGTLGEEGDYTTLGISLSQEDGQYLVANKLGEVGTVTSAPYDWPASGYEAWGGTSMATPHVVGVAALLWSADPGLTNAEIREAMNATAMDLGDEGWDPIFGNGLVQAYDALEYLSSPGQGPNGPNK